MSRNRLVRSLASTFGLAVLLGGLAVSFVSLVVAEAPSDFCCGRGRCCCARTAAPGADERSCLRRACGCQRPDAIIAGAPVTIEAVLPTPVAVADPGWRRLAGAAPSDRPLDRPHVPPLPPPRRPISS